MDILVINAGSSSLKYQLVDKETLQVLAKGNCEKIGLDDSFHKFEIGELSETRVMPIPDHQSAVQAALDVMLDPEAGCLKNLSEIVAVGHRIVHGGEYFSESVIITDEVRRRIEECILLAPLHNPPALMALRACSILMPNATPVAVFDTAFHQTMPAKAFMYALPYSCYKEMKIRRYGFHGTSHHYVAERAALLLGRSLTDMKMVTCHLGNGCSLAAIDGGFSVDTTMGFTPLEGVMMGTRCGSIDPAIVSYLIENKDLTPDDVNNLMNRKSGLLGISGVSNDLRDVQEAAAAGNEQAALAEQMYAHSIKKYLGQYAFEMGGLDVVVMTAGVGENSARMRELIFHNLGTMGIIIDPARNALSGGERIISSDNSRVTVAVIPTNEELVIVKDAIRLIG
ncbi:MAG: acetate kinase [Coriobacteriia bacterium]|nr:acetate kinase [Coriobacteriia bacterium]